MSHRHLLAFVGIVFCICAVARAKPRRSTAQATPQPSEAGYYPLPSDQQEDNRESGDNEPAEPRAPPPSVCNRPVGADVIVGVLGDFLNWGIEGDIVALSIGTTSCNVGSANLGWSRNSSDHPAIAQNLYRLKNGRFEQIGQSWLKHGFSVVAQNECECGSCNDPSGDQLLGVGCSDAYGAALNGNREGFNGFGGLGPRFEVNPHTGAFPWPYTTQGEPGDDDIYKRLQVRVADLDPAQNPGALYFGEGHYISADDAAAGNQNNNASYQPVTVISVNSDLDYDSDLLQREMPAIRAWKDTDPAVTETDVQIPNDGLLILSSKATDLGGGSWHYEYALYNMNADRAVKSFSVPLASGATVFNPGFHDVPYHSGDGFGTTVSNPVNFDGTDWPAVVASGSVTWTMSAASPVQNSNALRWGTLYNFRFDSNAAPVAGNATLGLFKTGTPASVTAAAPTPAGNVGPLDCNSNGIDDLTEVAGGSSQDCDSNGRPDECETTCTLAAVQVAAGLDQPAYVCAPPGDLDRLFIVELTGRIKILDLTTHTVLPAPFLDLSARISIGGERGLFTVAFHPNYAANGFFFVDYTNPAGNSVISRFTVSPDPDLADPNSELILKTISQPFANHNGGQLHFGPDGMLYVAMGDGGSGDDPLNLAQNRQSLLGKLLRLDVDNPPTFIPADNPFVADPLTMDEIWALGLRNPWRFSFDRLTGDLYIADVGQLNREEIDFQPAASPGGENYGWDCREGTICTPTGSGGYGCVCTDPTLVNPIFEIPRDGAPCMSLTGGYVYRGCDIPGLSGTYFYGDFCVPFIRSFRFDGTAVSDEQDRTAELQFAGNPISSIVSFGEDASGELYIVSILGAVYKIVCNSAAPVCGNGALEAGEACDDGNAQSGDGCFNCQLEIQECGNGTREAGEDCDDANAIAGDGCFNCQFEPHDLCADAVDVSEGLYSFSTLGALTDGPAHATCVQSGDGGQTFHDIWFRYIPFCNGTLTATTCEELGGAADYDTDVVLYNGDNCTSLVLLACDDDPDSGEPCFDADNFHSTVSAPVTAGNHYLIRVGGWQNGKQGGGILNLTNSGAPCNACGNGVVEPGEQCDPPGPTCDAGCQVIFEDCNSNDVDDLADVAGVTSTDCNSNGIPDECDAAADPALDCDGGPVGVRAGGQAIIGTFCFGCHDEDGSGGVGFPGPNLRNHSRVEIWNMLLPPTDHPGGAHPEFTMQNFADLEAFLADGGSRGRPDHILDVCQTLTDCDSDTLADACELEAATQLDADYNGVPDACENTCDGGPDCNSNGFADACDFAGGTSVDCNSNGVPDECDLSGGTALDCNANGVPDVCDLTTAGEEPLSLDCNGNSIPDECEFPACAGILPGDLSCDGLLNGLDIQLFVDRVLAGRYTCAADLNLNGALDADDLDRLVEALMSP